MNLTQRATSVLLVCATVLSPRSSSAQNGPPLGPDAVAAAGSPFTPHRIRWYEAVAMLGAVAGASVLDEPVQRYVQRHRSETTDDVSDVLRQAGEPIVYSGLVLGTTGLGLVIRRKDVTVTGLRMGASLVLAEGTTTALKYVVGRARPNAGEGAFAFHPFSGASADSTGESIRWSLPSGHTTAAFALATTVADAADRPVVSMLVYAIATGTGLSRINDNRHWLSDVALGAAIGITSAKLVEGRWQVFGLGAPRMLVNPAGGVGVGWSLYPARPPNSPRSSEGSRVQ